jgi:hypothetical protein
MDNQSHPHARCCPCSSGMTRRDFMGAAALGCVAMSGLAWKKTTMAESIKGAPITRQPLKVKPVLVYSAPQRRPQTSWRSWGGIHDQAAADREAGRIRKELETLKSQGDFPVEFLPLALIRGKGEVASLSDLSKSDVLLVYAAGGWLDTFDALHEAGKDMIFFCRHKSGPVYLWYEIISPRYLRQHTDTLAVQGIDDGDVVIDSQDEILWRLRSLCGLKNTLDSRIVAVGGPGAWAQPEGVVPDLVRKKWRFDIRTVSYDELGKLIQEARADQAAVNQARTRAEAYLASGNTTLETDRAFVDNAFLLDQVFRYILKEADCKNLTINSCMGTIMPLSKTSACLPLSTLNDDGYLAFCESDFVVIPSGVLLANISGKPVFLNDPTYPHDGIITLAHCTAPRRMDGRKIEPARILTHFESDYGAAPKVEMRRGQVLTNIAPDFKSERWLGIPAVIEDAPFMPICRSQIDVRFTCDSHTLAKRMPGFHWMTGYGDYGRELGYALKRVGIQWDLLG